MAQSSITEDLHFKVVVAADKLSSSILFSGKSDLPPPTLQDVLEAVQARKVQVDDQVMKRIEDFVRLASEKILTESEFVVAEGTPSVEGQDEQFIWDQALKSEAQDWQGDDAINYYEFASIITVEQDVTIGQLTPLVQGQEGMDVHGQVIKPTREPKAYELDETIRRDQDDSTLLKAAIAGRVIHGDFKLSLREVLSVAGDVDFKVCNIDSEVDVDVKGSILDLFEVKSAKSITVAGVVEAASVVAEENLFICGGILGRHKGRVSAGGEIVIRFGLEADLRAGGDIKVHNQLMSCCAQTEELFLAEHGAVIGGYLYARKGAKIRVLGNDAYVPTYIILGFHPRVLQEAAEINAGLSAKQNALTRMQSTIQALSQDESRLTPEQLEQCASLHIKAGEMDYELDADQQKLTQLLSDARTDESPCLQVADIIYPGVTVTFGSMGTTIRKELTGPLSIELRECGAEMEFVAVNQASGNEEVLPGVEIPIDKIFEGLSGGQISESPSE